MIVIVLAWFVHRVVQGHGLAYDFDSRRYLIFYGVLLVATYAAFAAGLYRLWLGNRAPALATNAR